MNRGILGVGISYYADLRNLTTNHPKNTNFLSEIPFFIRVVGVVGGKFSFHLQSRA
jgi:hypothetical protein